jgi:uncharacterized protein DUF4242
MRVVGRSWRRPTRLLALVDRPALNSCGSPQLIQLGRLPSVDGIDRPAYFALELTRPVEGWQYLDELILRARKAGDERSGNRVRFVRSVFIPEDETFLCVYAAASAKDVREAARRAGLQVGHVRGVIGEPVSREGRE